MEPLASFVQSYLSHSSPVVQNALARRIRVALLTSYGRGLLPTIPSDLLLAACSIRRPSFGNRTIYQLLPSLVQETIQKVVKEGLDLKWPLSPTSS